MDISTNPEHTIYRSLYENAGRITDRWAETLDDRPPNMKHLAKVVSMLCQGRRQWISIKNNIGWLCSH